jgi:group I intron endonuclease
MIGIYKITSPSNKIYIGQSSNIETRWYHYERLNCKNQYKLYNSLQKYGWENHKFEIIEECNLEQLNEREIYWGVQYSVLCEDGLNLRLGNGNGTFSKESKDKMSKAKKGKDNIKLKGIIRSNKTKQKISIAMSKSILQYDKQGNFIQEWPSTVEVNKILKICSPLLSKVCRGQKKTAGGFTWKYKVI